MRSKWIAFVVLLGLLSSAAGLASAGQVGGGRALVKIGLRSQVDLERVELVGLPVYAFLVTDDESYLLAGADPAERVALQRAGVDTQVLDAQPEGASYYLVYPRPGKALPRLSEYGRVLYDDGTQALLRISVQDADRLAAAGAQLSALTLDPKPLRPAAGTRSIPSDITPDPLIQAMIDQVNSGTIYTYTGDLSGQWAVDIGGSPYTITTRNTYSGTPIQKAVQYVGDHLANLGLGVEYHVWNASRPPNVIAELPGETNPDEIYIVCAHLDDMPSAGLAPGADDNASGTVAVLIAADILTQYRWGSTLRFALWTGEEQGLLGSAAYAQRAYNAGETIVGVLNLDMIAWNTKSSIRDIDLHARSTLPATISLANLFADVVSEYSLGLVPQIVPNGSGASDHASFWTYGYTSILGIEDFSDFNPYYHTSQDLQSNLLDKVYYLNFVKAAVGTFAHMSASLIGLPQMPEMAVQPDALSFVLDSGLVATTTITISNTGTGPLGYSIS